MTKINLEDLASIPEVTVDAKEVVAAMLQTMSETISNGRPSEMITMKPDFIPMVLSMLVSSAVSSTIEMIYDTQPERRIAQMQASHLVHTMNRMMTAGLLHSIKNIT